MKITDVISETPYLHPGEMSRNVLDRSYSQNTIGTAFRQIGTVSDLTVLMGNQDRTVIAVAPNQTNANRIRPTLALLLKTHNELKFKHTFENVIQVDKVSIAVGYSRAGIASEVYRLIVSQGYTLVSDSTQFETAQALWKNLAQSGRYPVYVADVDNGVFRGSDGNPIRYNGTNIPDYDIWSSGSDYNGSYRVLILSPVEI